MPITFRDKIECYDYLSDRPAPEAYGVGVCCAAGELYKSDGITWTDVGTASYTPSIYSGLKSATTTVTGQSEAIATGATKLQVVNKDATNSLYIGLGTSQATAEAACSSGTAGVDKFLLLADSMLTVPISDYTYYAWLGVGGTVSTRVTQGV